ncbi:HET-domain-containing protein [Amniculicola lignicola CBS 123094]|uniref:HET-domain-containing protein n=1 Tax=Amniculicola lignicola CBS 123094 TaxID=1392246 RepID=A0A6A5W537_9PLEO|nr:HET-domain-containing protein [Amniculicola lignicola CBS 123094]
MSFQYPLPEFPALRRIWRRQTLDRASLRVFELTTDPWIKHRDFARQDSETGELCHICRNIDFEWLGKNPLSTHPWSLLGGASSRPMFSFSLARPTPHHVLQVEIPPAPGWHLLPRIPLGFLLDIADRRHCKFCQLMVYSICLVFRMKKEDLPGMRLTGYGSPPRGLPVAAEDIVCYLDNADKGSPNHCGIYSLRVRLAHYHGFGGLRAVDIHEISGSQIPHGGRRVTPQVDFGILKRWMETSPLRELPLSMQERAKVLLGFRLIDVVHGCVVPASLEWRYIALSYVWGRCKVLKNETSIKKQLEQPGSLRQLEPPRTVQDAIELVRSLGERYLWVDALCIIQDDQADKDSQIGSMALVYSCAIATIVAAAGDDANAGLPGVQPESRLAWQRIETIQGRSFTNRWEFDAPTSRSYRDLNHFLEMSTWITRGWTFQESALSRRLIVFLPTIVLFQSAGIFREEDIYDSEDAETLCERGLHYFNMLSTLHQDGLARDKYFEALWYYSTRRLSYPGDALNAFAAVLDVLKPLFRCEYVYGLPANEFDVALLWLPGSKLQRRIDSSTGKQCFPSWSWAGWEGVIDYPLGYGNFPRVTWIDAVDGTPFVSETGIGRSNEEWRPAIQSQDSTYNPKRTLDDPEQLQPAEHQPSRRFLVPGQSHLRFKALMATLPLVPLHYHMRHWKVRNNIHLDAGICSYAIENITKRSPWAGCVYIHHDTIKRGDPINFDFELVAISRTTHPRLATGEGIPPADDSDLYEWAKNYDYEAWVAEKEREKERNGPMLISLVGGNTDVCWPAYDVLVVTYVDQVAYRVGVGIVHAEAFHLAGPLRKEIVLG